MMANVMENITLNPTQSETPFEIFSGRKTKLYGRLIEFGRICYVKSLSRPKN